MAGVEILGIAASVAQIADLGARLSVKLFVFSRKIKSADKSIEAISQDIASTGAVLQELGKEISNKDTNELLTQEGLRIAHDLITSCQKVFNELDTALDGRVTDNSIVKAWRSRLKYPFIEAQVELLRLNLERLKSSLVLVLNALILTIHVKSHKNIDALRDHIALGETLVEEKHASEKRHQSAMKAIERRASGASKEQGEKEAPPTDGTSELLASRSDNAKTANTGMLDFIQTPVLEDSTLPSHLTERGEAILHSAAAVDTLLAQVCSLQYKIDHAFRDRLHRGILVAHWEHFSPLREVHGAEALMQAFASHTELVRFWVSRANNLVARNKAPHLTHQIPVPCYPTVPQYVSVPYPDLDLNLAYALAGSLPDRVMQRHPSSDANMSVKDHNSVQHSTVGAPFTKQNLEKVEISSNKTVKEATVMNTPLATTTDHIAQISTGREKENIGEERIYHSPARRPVPRKEPRKPVERNMVAIHHNSITVDDHGRRSGFSHSRWKPLEETVWKSTDSGSIEHTDEEKSRMDAKPVRSSPPPTSAAGTMSNNAFDPMYLPETGSTSPLHRQSASQNPKHGKISLSEFLTDESLGCWTAPTAALSESTTPKLNSIDAPALPYNGLNTHPLEDGLLDSQLNFGDLDAMPPLIPQNSSDESASMHTDPLPNEALTWSGSREYEDTLSDTTTATQTSSGGLEHFHPLGPSKSQPAAHADTAPLESEGGSDAEKPESWFKALKAARHSYAETMDTAKDKERGRDQVSYDAKLPEADISNEVELAGASFEDYLSRWTRISNDEYKSIAV
ncbi:hypothetical protein H2200_012175 [Cladophialophora chaetospira]|uniref:Fungal N-terminal domain-containing protein n=1 Tax=Cladophialophora chaetospira TaxID=386627 RepID=A0AA39CCM8_9EURO|nr:hypothetical protein H2200_012175 [Cladophialophora chaetospira]